MDETVTCACCGRVLPKSESELGFDLPDDVFALAKDERKKRCRLSSDACVLDERRFFVRGGLPLPVRGRTEPYHLGVWAEVSRASFSRIYELWTDPAQASEPAYSGTLANSVPLHFSTLGLLLRVRLTGPTTRPEFYLEGMNHSLYAEQHGGIEEHRALEYSDRASTNRPSN